MKIKRIGEPEIIMSNPNSTYNYFGWPTVARLRDGRIAVGASGFRRRHVCPWGKAVLAYSSDEGQSYTPPSPVIDTSLDDRDCGILAFGENGIFVTSFNNTVNFQRQHAADELDTRHLDTVSPEEEARDLGATFRISLDGGAHFGPVFKSPVTSPHGPLELSDGTLLWLGRTFSKENGKTETDCLQVHRVYTDGRTEFVGQIDNIEWNGALPLLCEPHALPLENGDLLAHIRVQYYPAGLFTTFQSRSKDLGKTWSKPVQILADDGGAPAHLLRHSSGLLLSTYGYRKGPYGIKVMCSRDGGESWSKSEDLYVNNVSGDLGYPSTVELRDGSLLSVFYAIPKAGDPAVIMQQKWRIEHE